MTNNTPKSITKTAALLLLSATLSSLSANDYYNAYSVEVDYKGNPIVKDEITPSYPKTIKEKNGIKIIGDDIDVKTMSIKEARKLLKKKNISLDKTHKQITILKNTKNEVVYVAKNLTKEEINVIKNLIKSGKHINIQKDNYITVMQKKKNYETHIGNVKEKILMEKPMGSKIIKEQSIEIVEVNVSNKNFNHIVKKKSKKISNDADDKIINELEKNSKDKSQKFKTLSSKKD